VTSLSNSKQQQQQRGIATSPTHVHDYDFSPFVEDMGQVEKATLTGRGLGWSPFSPILNKDLT
jgi:hypothetical protein